MTGSELLEKWIEVQQKNGKTDDQIVGDFIYKDTYYQLKQSRKVGKFDLKARVGCVDLSEFEVELV
jgi:hypothetical protein